jgi:hypothetical protein
VGFNWWREAEPDETSAQAIINRVTAEIRAEQSQAQARVRLHDDSMWPSGWPHEAPERPLDVPEAHQIMQQHRTCRADQCPRKEAARRTLIDAGRMKPDTSRMR